METTAEARLLTNTEMGAVILLMRKMHQWSQETLAELSGLTTRTIQRIEYGEGCSADSRRALAKAFDIEDLDIYNKPFKIPSQEELELQKATFEKERITIPAIPIVKGKELAKFAETTEAHLFTSKDDLPETAELAIAEIEDMFVDYRDSHDCYSATEKLNIYAEFQGKMDALHEAGAELSVSTRRVPIKSKDVEQKPLIFTVLYVLASRKGDSPESLAVSREISFG